MEVDSRRKLWRTFLTVSSFSGMSYLFIFHKSFLSWFATWFRWCPTSSALLEKAEQQILSYVQKPMELLFVRIPPFDEVKEECDIRTLIIKDDNKNAEPLVLLHGFASGVGLWILNLEQLSENRTLYAFDLLGFGRSSRPPFNKDAELAEEQFIESIEQWRKKVNLDHFILLGHSMGGFLAASYALKYPDRVKHLILADPWGFPETDLTRLKKIRIPIWAKVIAQMLKPFNPLAGLRAVGPWGPRVVQRFRPDIMGKFEHIVENTSDVSDYIYHCNAQTPSGEAAFKSMTFQFGWAKRPMINRIAEIRPDISITFIFGSNSWIESSSGILSASLRPNSSVEVKLLEGAGHHVYADRSKEFNKLVQHTCNNVDKGIYAFLFTKKNSIERTLDDSIKNSDCEVVL